MFLPPHGLILHIVSAFPEWGLIPPSTWSSGAWLWSFIVWWEGFEGGPKRVASRAPVVKIGKNRVEKAQPQKRTKRTWIMNNGPVQNPCRSCEMIVIDEKTAFTTRCSTPLWDFEKSDNANLGLNWVSILRLLLEACPSEIQAAERSCTNEPKVGPNSGSDLWRLFFRSVLQYSEQFIYTSHNKKKLYIPNSFNARPHTDKLDRHFHFLCLSWSALLLSWAPRRSSNQLIGVRRSRELAELCTFI